MKKHKVSPSVPADIFQVWDNFLTEKVKFVQNYETSAGWYFQNKRLFENRFRTAHLKGNSANFTHSGLFTGLSVDYSILKKLQRKLQAIWEKATSDVTQWLSCIVGNVGLHWWQFKNKLLDSIKWNQRYHLFNSTNSSSFAKPGAYITHNAT